MITKESLLKEMKDLVLLTYNIGEQQVALTLAKRKEGITQQEIEGINHQLSGVLLLVKNVDDRQKLLKENLSLISPDDFTWMEKEYSVWFEKEIRPKIALRHQANPSQR